MNEYMKLKEYMRYFVIPLIIAIVAVVLTYVLELSITYGVILVVSVFIISLLIISLLIILDLIKDLKHLEKGDEEASTTSFIEKVYPFKVETAWEKEINLISEATNSVKILGISHRTRLARHRFEDTLIKAGEKGVEITILILDHNGKNLDPKAVDEGEDPKGWEKDIASSIIKFKQIKRDHQQIKNLELYTYDIFPIWHMVIIDVDKGLIGYYPTRRPGGESPLYLIKKGDLSLLTPFIKYFNSIKDSGKRIIAKED